ncbi:MAG: hypothetical protein ABJ375_13100 [Rhizobiaceae bacterium]
MEKSAVPAVDPIWDVLRASRTYIDPSLDYPRRWIPSPFFREHFSPFWVDRKWNSDFKEFLDVARVVFQVRKADEFDYFHARLRSNSNTSRLLGTIRDAWKAPNRTVK